MMYVRDKRSPVPKSEATSRVMSANRGRDTGPELKLRKALWSAGHRGYRLHFKKAPGRPDIAYVSKKIAIFVHGCFWHRCPKCDYPLPKNNTEFWKAKFDRNVARDARKKADLKRAGWKVITIWECDLKKRFAASIARIIKTIS